MMGRKLDTIDPSNPDSDNDGMTGRKSTTVLTQIIQTLMEMDWMTVMKMRLDRTQITMTPTEMG